VRNYLFLTMTFLLFGCGAEPPVQYSEDYGQFRPVNLGTKYSAQQIKDAQDRKSELIGTQRSTQQRSIIRSDDHGDS